MPDMKVVGEVPVSGASSSTAVSTGAKPLSLANREHAGITREIISVIEAAVNAYAGKKVRVLSVKVCSDSRPVSSPWANQGRNIIHGSHNMFSADTSRLPGLRCRLFEKVPRDNAH